MVAGFCRRGNWAITGRNLAVCAPGGTRCDHFVIEAMPSSVSQLFERVLNLTRLSCPPKPVWLRDAHGAGGFFTPGLVALGRADVLRVAGEVWDRLDAQQWLYAFVPGRCVSRQEVQNAVVEFLVAHELGHAAQEQRGDGMTRLQAEADADRHAGAVAEVLGWDQELHELVAFAIGCTGSVCFHPSPSERVRHTRRGREAQRQFEQQQAQRLW